MFKVRQNLKYFNIAEECFDRLSLNKKERLIVTFLCDAVVFSATYFGLKLVVENWFKDDNSAVGVQKKWGRERDF